MTVSVPDLARQLKLKPRRVKGVVEYGGPNPFESGADNTGFWLRSDGTAYDRQLESNYNSYEVATHAGIAPHDYEGCQNWMDEQRRIGNGQEKRDFRIPALPAPKPKAIVKPKTPKVFDTSSLAQRGIAPQTLDAFAVREIDLLASVLQRNPSWDEADVAAHTDLSPHDRTDATGDGCGRSGLRGVVPAWVYPAPLMDDLLAPMPDTVPPSGQPPRQGLCKGRMKFRFPALHGDSKYMWTGKAVTDESGQLVPRPRALIYGVPNIRAAMERGHRHLWILNGEVSVWLAHTLGIPAISLFGEGNDSARAVEQLAMLCDRATGEAAFDGFSLVADNDSKGRKSAAKLWCDLIDAGFECDVHYFPQSWDVKKGYDATDSMGEALLMGEAKVNPLSQQWYTSGNDDILRALPIATNELADWQCEV